MNAARSVSRTIDELPSVTHVCALTTVRSPSQAPARLYTLYRVEGERSEAFVPLLQFYLDRGVSRRLAWQRSHARSVRLLLDHLVARGEEVGRAATNALQRFVDDLVAGTMAEDGTDPTGLRWPPNSPAVVEAHLGRINVFTD